MFTTVSAKELGSEPQTVEKNTIYGRNGDNDRFIECGKSQSEETSPGALAFSPPKRTKTNKIKLM